MDRPRIGSEGLDLLLREELRSLIARASIIESLERGGKLSPREALRRILEELTVVAEAYGSLYRDAG